MLSYYGSPETSLYSTELAILEGLHRHGYGGVGMVLERGGRELGASTESTTLQGILTFLRRAFGNENKKVVDHSYAGVSKREEKATKMGLLKSIESLGNNSAMI